MEDGSKKGTSTPELNNSAGWQDHREIEVCTRCWPTRNNSAVSVKIADIIGLRNSKIVLQIYLAQVQNDDCKFAGNSRRLEAQAKVPVSG